MEYTTVFIITDKPYQWWFLLIGPVGLIMGISFLLLYAKWPMRFSIPTRIAGYVTVMFGVLWTIFVFFTTYLEYRACINAYRNGTYAVVEGTVVDFRPMPYEGHQDECFRVSGINFCYSDYAIQPGFNKTASHGGPIREGLSVRIAYYDGQILKLEIARKEFRSTDQRVRKIL